MRTVSWVFLSLAYGVFASPSSSSLPKKCKMLFDGRVAVPTTPADFDKNSSIFDHQFVHGENQTWAEIIKFPAVPPSLFDIPKGAKPVEVTISNRSIFLPGGDPPMPQFGFRRSELIPATNNGTDITVQGTTTFHWSIRDDPLRPLNFSHEYHPAWHETADFSTSEITFLTGKPFNQSFDPTVHDPKTLRLAGRQSNSPETTFFQTPFIFDVWHNFAVTLGWESNLLTVYYSKGYAPLKKVAGPAFNDNSGGGQFHTGVFKLPTGPLGIDVLHEGFQEAPINEGLIFGGIFIEDSADGCVTLSP
ncbi:glycoside hydrolase family 131 protein [Sphaerobolus stellatus SS14]|nr:glycoside hydrolase family 131 protein [Sphaerobolus stellatus SS14]